MRGSLAPFTCVDRSICVQTTSGAFLGKEEEGSMCCEGFHIGKGFGTYCLWLSGIQDSWGFECPWFVWHSPRWGLEGWLVFLRPHQEGHGQTFRAKWEPDFFSGMVVPEMDSVVKFSRYFASIGVLRMQRLENLKSLRPLWILSLVSSISGRNLEKSNLAMTECHAFETVLVESQNLTSALG